MASNAFLEKPFFLRRLWLLSTCEDLASEHSGITLTSEVVSCFRRLKIGGISLDPPTKSFKRYGNHPVEDNLVL